MLISSCSDLLFVYVTLKVPRAAPHSLRHKPHQSSAIGTFPFGTTDLITPNWLHVVCDRDSLTVARMHGISSRTSSSSLTHHHPSFPPNAYQCLVSASPHHYLCVVRAPGLAVANTHAAAAFDTPRARSSAQDSYGTPPPRGGDPDLKILGIRKNTRAPHGTQHILGKGWPSRIHWRKAL